MIYLRRGVHIVEDLPQNMQYFARTAEHRFKAEKQFRVNAS